MSLDFTEINRIVPDGTQRVVTTTFGTYNRIVAPATTTFRTAIVAGKPVLGFNRCTDVCTFTASSAAAGYAASNLGQLPLGVPWQATSSAAQYIDGQFDQVRYVGGFWLCRPTLTDAATFRLRLWLEPIAGRSTLLYDSSTDYGLVGGQRFWPIAFQDNPALWNGESGSAVGSYTTRQKSDTVFHRPIILAQQYACQSWRLDLIDTATPALGMIEMAQTWQFSRNWTVGKSDDFETRTTTVVPFGGSDIQQRLAKKRLTTGDLNLLPRWEVENVVYEMMREYDLDTPFGYCADPTDPSTWMRECYLAKFAKLTPRQRSLFKYASAGVALREAF